MKILQLTAHFRPNVGGVETHLDDLVSALIKRVDEVFVLTYQPLVTEASWKIYESDKNFKVLRIPWFPGFFYKLVKNPALEFLYLVPGLFFVTPLVLLIEHPNVIHSHGLVAGFAGVFWAKIFRIRVITTTHSIYHFPDKGLYYNFSKWLFSSSDCVLVLSKQSKKEVESLGVNPNKIKIFTYWIDLDRFKVTSNRLKVRKKLGWSNKFIVLFVGRLVIEKGVLQLLEAVKDWNKNIFLAIAGVGPLEPKVREEARINSNILYLGNVEQEEMPKFYNTADVTVIPSIHEEGFGRVILESLACGTPVIGSRRGAIPEAMDETVGKLIDVTPRNIKRVVEYFYKNPAKLEKLAKNARKFAEKRYSKKNVDIIIRSYE